MRICCDIETDGLNPTKIWCCVCKELGEDKWYIFRDGDADKAREFFKGCEEIIGHNFICFDMKVLNKLWHCGIRLKQVTDTLILSRLDNPKRPNGHKLAEWGKFLKVYKDHYEDWSKWTQEMEDYCKQDVRVTEAVFNKLSFLHKVVPKATIWREYQAQYILEKQKEYGFYMNLKDMLVLKAEIDADYLKLVSQLKKDFPPYLKPIGVYTPRRTKDGEICKVSQRILNRPTTKDNGDGTYTLNEWKEFNINSPSDLVVRLKPYWKPFVFTKPSKLHPNGSPKVCPENLETIGEDAPESIQNLVRCKIDASRSTLLQSFLDATDTNGRLHGTVSSIGASTHRMAHTNPNTANVPSSGLYGERIRSLFTVPKGYKIVGCDAKGIQLRALAHYTGDKKLIEEILSGDIHVHLAKIYGLMDPDVEYDENIPALKKQRKTSKTTTYTILMGGGAGKVGIITGLNGKKVMNSLNNGVEGLKRLHKQFRYQAAVGYYKALDGRRVLLENEHLAMSSHLQSFEQAVVKWVMVEAFKRLKKAHLDFHQVAVVHDEIQYEVREDQVEQLSTIVCQCFKEAGEYFHSRCPLEGDVKFGDNWSESH